MVQKKAVLYCRVSTVDQNCGRQERDLINFAKRAGYKVTGVFREQASGAKNDRVERQKIIGLARQKKIDVVLVTELTRWGRSTQDLLDTLRQLADWRVSVKAQTGLDCDLNTPQGKLFLTIMAGLAEFERDLIRERVCSGLAAAKHRGKKLGRQPGFNPSDKFANKVLHYIGHGKSYRWIAKDLQISKTTVVNILKRHKLTA